MNKYIKHGAIIGGIWGLITGILYTFGVFASSFSGYGDIGILLKNIPVIWKIIYLPAFLTDTFGGLLGEWILYFAILGPIFFLIIWCIGLPIVIGVSMGAIIGYLIGRYKK